MRSHSSGVSPEPRVGNLDAHLARLHFACACVSVPPCGMASMAFSTRLEMARCSSSGSAAIASRCGSSSAVAANLRPPRRRELRLQELNHTLNHLVYLHRLQVRLRHFRKLAEAPDDRLQVRQFRQQRPRTFPKHVLELFRTLLPRPHQILHRELQGKQRVLQFVRQPPRQLAPCRHALGLNQALPLGQ